MASKRMFAKTVIDSDQFLDMPVTARLLYYDLAMRADDDGFVNSPKKIMRIVGASPDDLSILALKKFIIPFESGVVVIRHWKIHNYIRGDTYQSTQCIDEKAQLMLDENKAYSLCVGDPSTVRQLPVDGSVTQDSIGKDSIDIDLLKKESIKKEKTPKRFVPPTLEEVKAYCTERGNDVDAQRFVDYYTSNGWQVGKNKMKDWKAAVRTWERNRTQPKPEKEFTLDDWYR